MLIKNIEVKNFKSFRHLNIELGRFNIFIGPNGAGKSNFLDIFTFLRDILSHGLANAISMQGEEYLRNVNLVGEKDNLSVKFTLAPVNEKTFRRFMLPDQLDIKLNELTYEFTIAFNGTSGKYSIKKDRLVQDFEVFSTDGKTDRSSLIIANDKGRLNYKLRTTFGKKSLFNTFIEELTNSFKYHYSADKLIIEHQIFFIPIILNAAEFISKISVYDFDSSFPKRATSLAGRVELEENGRNLAIVLKNILADEEKRRMLFNLVQEILPFIENIQVEKYIDKYLQILFRETYSGKNVLPAFAMSEGTIFIIDIIVALYFENKFLSIFDEPERRIHPYLISRLVHMMSDASQGKQIIISTHNPEIVKHADNECLYLVSRDEEGFSTIIKPHEKEEIQAFLLNEIGIEELFVQNILGS